MENNNDWIDEFFDNNPEIELPKLFTLRPELLQHPNIPKPLHGLAPRVIKGQEWWDKTREDAYASTGYHCLACGVHKTDANYHNWLEAHEDYAFNLRTGEVRIKQIIPLCHSCHNFIHSGRLSITAERDKIIDILKHGFKILEDNNLDVSEATYMIAEEVGLKHNSKAIDCGVPEDEICNVWSEWHLILDGKKYYSKFKDMEEWRRFYNNN
tara:strand:- start:2541 stop:3173 length:633 start_codon:yes stop_codon:yes gene_type:complete